MFQFKVVENMLATKASLFRTQICDCNVCPQCLNTLLRSHVLSLLLRSCLLEDILNLVDQYNWATVSLT